MGTWMTEAVRLALASAVAALAMTAAPALAQDTDGHGHDMMFWAVQLEQLERRWDGGTGSQHWEAMAWYGGDTDRLVLRTEGEKPDGAGVEEAEVRLLWSRMLDDFWNLETGLRHAVRPRPQTTSLALGFVGLAPYFIESEAFAYLSEEGDVTAEVKGEFELLLTQRLHLVTEAKLDLSAQQVEDLGLGAGPTALGIGTRLKYEVVRKVAPYVGLVWDRRLGRTADFARAEGEDADSLSLVTGVSVWF